MARVSWQGLVPGPSNRPDRRAEWKRSCANVPGANVQVHPSSLGGCLLSIRHPPSSILSPMRSKETVGARARRQPESCGSQEKPESGVQVLLERVFSKANLNDCSLLWNFCRSSSQFSTAQPTSLPAPSFPKSLS